MLPGLTGLEICRRLRATGSTVPVILLTAKDEVSDRVAGLDAGADDYVVKPFSIEELLARIRAHLCRTQETDEDLLQFEDLSLNRRTREVFRVKRSIELTAKEFDLLEYLLSHPRQVFTRDQILEGKLKIHDETVRLRVNIDIEVVATRSLGIRSVKQTNY